MRITVLGSGTSAGVPLVGCHCAVCCSADPRNKRRRASIYVEWNGVRILVDAGPDLRMQCIDAKIGAIDGLVFTHAHADHIHGIDDLRAINNVIDAPIDTYADVKVLARIRSRFEYAFLGGSRGHGYYRPELRPHEIDGPFSIGGQEIVPFEQAHGGAVTWGFRFGKFAYSTDADDLDQKAFDTLEGVEVWLVDALRDKPHPTHAHLERTLEWIGRLQPQRAFLTHMAHDVDYHDWARRLPDHIRPAYDGLVIEIED
ncbi:MAG: MBL fold metallo-hydrolase [Pseudomonadota bacterium]